MSLHITRRVPRRSGISYPVVRCTCGQEVHCEEPAGNECMRCGAEYGGSGRRMKLKPLDRDEVEELRL